MWWKLLAGAVVVALAGLLIWRFGEAKFEAGTLDERVKWKDSALNQQKEINKLELSFAAGKVAAVEDYAERLAAMEPLVVRSRETVTRYAQTNEGRTLCLAPERVYGIEQDRGAIFPGYSGSAIGGAPAVSPDASPDRPTGIAEQRR